MAAAHAKRTLGLLGASWAICKKDVRIEVRTREVLTTAGFFALVVVVLASMSYFVNPKYNRATAAATIWIAVFFASTLSFSRIWQREREESALTGLLVAPIPRAAIFLGKALATFGTILVFTVPLILVAMFLFAIDFSLPDNAVRDPNVHEPWTLHLAAFAGLVVLATLVLALVGTLFGPMTVKARARDLVLAVVMLPVLSPVLLCAVAGTRKAFETQPLDEYIAYLAFLGIAATVTLAVGTGFFGGLVDD